MCDACRGANDARRSSGGAASKGHSCCCEAVESGICSVAPQEPTTLQQHGLLTEKSRYRHYALVLSPPQHHDQGPSGADLGSSGSEDDLKLNVNPKRIRFSSAVTSKSLTESAASLGRPRAGSSNSGGAGQGRSFRNSVPDDDDDDASDDYASSSMTHPGWGTGPPAPLAASARDVGARSSSDRLALASHSSSGPLLLPSAPASSSYREPDYDRDTSSRPSAATHSSGAVDSSSPRPADLFTGGSAYKSSVPALLARLPFLLESERLEAAAVLEARKDGALDAIRASCQPLLDTIWAAYDDATASVDASGARVAQVITGAEEAAQDAMDRIFPEAAAFTASLQAAYDALRGAAEGAGALGLGTGDGAAAPQAQGFPSAVASSSGAFAGPRAASSSSAAAASSSPSSGGGGADDGDTPASLLAELQGLHRSLLTAFATADAALQGSYSRMDEAIAALDASIAAGAAASVLHLDTDLDAEGSGAL